MAMDVSSSRQVLCQRRVLRDMADLRADPYPNIGINLDPVSLGRVCLVLRVDGRIRPLHFTIMLGGQRNRRLPFPLHPPRVTLDTPLGVDHPNVVGRHVCTSMLWATNGDFTPAYTLKTIAIQLLSLFGRLGPPRNHNHAAMNPSAS